MAPRILVVEDDEAVRRVTAAILAREGYEVVEAASGAAGLEALRRQPVDLIVSDVTMPGMTGPEMVQQAWELAPGLPVVFVTGFCLSAIPCDMIARAVIVTKPFSPEALLNAVRFAAPRDESAA